MWIGDFTKQNTSTNYLTTLDQDYVHHHVKHDGSIVLKILCVRREEVKLK